MMSMGILIFEAISRKQEAGITGQVWQPMQRQFVFSAAPAVQTTPPTFLEALGALLTANPPPPGLRSTFQRLASIGLSVDKGFDPTVLDAESRSSLDAAIALSRKDIPRLAQQPRRGEAGWVIFDFGPAVPGTLEEMIARAHIGPDAFAALPGTELAYAVGYADSGGQPLQGDRRYVVTLPTRRRLTASGHSRSIRPAAEPCLARAIPSTPPRLI